MKRYTEYKSTQCLLHIDLKYLWNRKIEFVLFERSLNNVTSFAVFVSLLRFWDISVCLICKLNISHMHNELSEKVINLCYWQTKSLENVLVPKPRNNAMSFGLCICERVLLFSYAIKFTTNTNKNIQVWDIFTWENYKVTHLLKGFPKILNIFFSFCFSVCFTYMYVCSIRVNERVYVFWALRTYT